jgi:hypothetical protein
MYNNSNYYALYRELNTDPLSELFKRTSLVCIVLAVSNVPSVPQIIPLFFYILLTVHPEAILDLQPT